MHSCDGMSYYTKCSDEIEIITCGFVLRLKFMKISIHESELKYLRLYVTSSTSCPITILSYNF